MEITVYTRTTCAPCRTVKTWLQKKGFKYRELNVDDNPEYMAEAMRFAGAPIVPVTLVANLSGISIVTGANLLLLSSVLMV